MTLAQVFAASAETTDPLADVVHTVCGFCLAAARTPVPLLSYCGVDVTFDQELPYANYGPDECAMCLEAVRGPCPMCRRVAW